MMAAAMTAAAPLSRVKMFWYSEVARTLKPVGSPRMKVTPNSPRTFARIKVAAETMAGRISGTRMVRTTVP